MSNYPNRSSCMCENTLLAMWQIMNAMREEGPRFLQDMHRDERRAYQELFNICEEFLTAAEELQEEVDDGEPDEAQEWRWIFDPDPDC